jgi:hypothetical protein
MPLKSSIKILRKKNSRFVPESVIFIIYNKDRAMDKIEVFSTTALTDLKFVLETRPKLTDDQKNELYHAIIDLVEEFEQCMLEDAINMMVEESTYQSVIAATKQEEPQEEKETYLAETKCDFLKITRPIDEKYED